VLPVPLLLGHWRRAVSANDDHNGLAAGAAADDRRRQLLRANRFVVGSRE